MKRFYQIAMALIMALTLTSVASAHPQKSGTKAQPAKTEQQQLDKKTANISTPDRQFVIKAAQGSLAEVEMGKLAVEKATNSDVKQFGQRMIDDHTKATQELQQLATQKGITLPKEISANDRAHLNTMKKLSGDQFDRKFMDHMVKDHQKDVAEFQKASKQSKDQDVKNWANQTLPILQTHLELAKTTDAKLSIKPVVPPTPQH